MAYAELGDMKSAIDTVREAIKIAESAQQEARLVELQEHLREYEQGRPIRAAKP